MITGEKFVFSEGEEGKIASAIENC
jgi:hypothetical protein